MSTQSDNLNRAKQEQKRAQEAERVARKAYEREPKSSNLAAKRAWDSAKCNLRDAESAVRQRQAEYDQASRGQSRSWI